MVITMVVFNTHLVQTRYIKKKYQETADRTKYRYLYNMYIGLRNLSLDNC